MLTDIFATRYVGAPIWQAFGESERRLLVQAFRIVSEQIHPYFGADGKEREGAKVIWKSMHDRLSMELGLQELSPRGYWRETMIAGNKHQYWQETAWVYVCQSFVCAGYPSGAPADRFIKERLSFVEIAFRDKEAFAATMTATLDERIAKAEQEAQRYSARTMRIPGNVADGLRAHTLAINQEFQSAVAELNTRFRQAGANLNYHNGFIQMADDHLLERQVETPFWSLVNTTRWQNVDTDMKEALDRRDSGQRDPAFYAARALESAIKIISAEKGWTHGGERGAHSFIDNLAAQRSGGFITRWEQSALKSFFTDVRNDLGHGPGNEPMPELTPQQTSWAIEFCMSWIKSLIGRM